jgi:hypothetical protein
MTFKLEAIFLYYLLESLVEISWQWIGFVKFEIHCIVMLGHGFIVEVLYRRLKELFYRLSSEVEQVISSWNCHFLSDGVRCGIVG